MQVGWQVDLNPLGVNSQDPPRPEILMQFMVISIPPGTLPKD